MYKYSRFSRVLHWVSALIILWAIVTGALLRVYSIDLDLKQAIVSFNVATTTVFIPVFIVRVINTLVSNKPGPLSRSVFTDKAAKLAHLSLYFLTGVVLLSGVLMMGDNINLYGVVSIKNPVDSAYWNTLFSGVHVYSCITLAFFIFIHISAVVFHHLTGVNVISRMV